MGIEQRELVIDCADHEVIVPFWEAALAGSDVMSTTSTFALVPPASGTEIRGRTRVRLRSPCCSESA